MTLRDARTVLPKEPVWFAQSAYVKRAATFVAVVRNDGADYLRIELPEGTFDVLASSERVWAEDRNGTPLGIPDPLLPTGTPDLE